MPYGSRPLLILGSGVAVCLALRAALQLPIPCQGPKPVQGWFRYCGGLTISGKTVSFATGLYIIKDGDLKPSTGDGILFFPAGLPGPAFIVTPNFEVIKDYNDSDVYALAIGHLSDLMQGAGSFKAPWPVQPTQLPRDDRIALQKKLASLGYDQTRFSAHIDFKMRDFVRSEQKKHGLVTDGQPNAALMDKMGVKRQPP